MMSTPKTKLTGTTNTPLDKSSREQLESDLSLFLSNPKLTQQLAEGSLDLLGYSAVVEQELHELESECISIYNTKTKDILQLKEEIEACDNVLTSLQEMLFGFQADLGGLSSDIRLLQEQSHTLEVQLRNRKRAELLLRGFLEQIIIPPNVAQVICHKPVDETFMHCVETLNSKYANVCTTLRSVEDQERRRLMLGDETKEELFGNEDTTVNMEALAKVLPMPCETTAGHEMKGHIQTLRLKAVQRIREYFLLKIGELRKPKTNVRMIQVNSLLKYSSLNAFLYDISQEISQQSRTSSSESSTNVYQEVKDAYVDSMSKTLVALFRTYHAQLSRLLEGGQDSVSGAASRTAAAGRQDLIAVEESSLRRDMFSTKLNLSKRTDTFFLGGRVAVLDLLQDRAPPLLAHEALLEERQYPYEMLFRSILTHLMDAALNEFVVCHSFFIHNTPHTSNDDDGQSSVAGSVSAASASHMSAFGIAGMDKDSLEFTFHSIFHKTLGALLEHVENYLFYCYDCLAVLLMIKLTHASRRMMHLRKVYVLDGFLERLTQLLWPRLKIIMDAQLRSLRLATASKLGGVELHAHYVSRRYAEFTASVLLILNKGGKHPPPAARISKEKRTLSRPSRDGNMGGDNSLHNSSHGGNGGNGRQTSLSRHNSGTGQESLHSTASSANSAHHYSDGHMNSKISSHSGKGNISSHGNMSTHGGGTVLHGGGRNNRGSAGDMLMHDLSLITQETIALLERLADELPNHKSRIVFLINNFDQIIQIFQERRVGVTSQEMTKFMDLLLQQREFFVEEELLSQGFSKMIAFVQQTEAHLAQLTPARGAAPPTSTGRSTSAAAAVGEINEAVVEALVRDFAAHWKRGIENINRNVLSYFSNFRNGMEILKQVLTQLLLYYTRFQDIIRKHWRQKPPAWAKDLVSTSLILAEIKKYALSI